MAEIAKYYQRADSVTAVRRFVATAQDSQFKLVETERQEAHIWQECMLFTSSAEKFRPLATCNRTVMEIRAALHISPTFKGRAGDFRR